MSDEKPKTPPMISDIFVPTAQSRHAFSRFEELMERGRERHFCRALLLFGLSRTGKTHMVQQWLAEHRKAVEAAGGTFTYLTAEVPAGATLRAIAAEILSQTRDPNPTYGSQTMLTQRLHTNARGRHLLVVEEVQRVIDENTGRVRPDVANWLVGFLNKGVCPLLLVGEPAAELIFRDRVYFKGRTLGQVNVWPYDWNRPDDQLEFRVFLNVIDGQLGLPERSNLGDTDTALRIYIFSDGRIGMAALLLDEARALARHRGRPAITRDLLAEATDLLRVGEDRRAPNPFRDEAPLDVAATRQQAENRRLVPQTGPSPKRKVRGDAV